MSEREVPEDGYLVSDPLPEDELYHRLRHELNLRKREVARCLRSFHAERLLSASSGVPAASLTVLGKARQSLALRHFSLSLDRLKDFIPESPRIPGEWTCPKKCLLYDVRRSQRGDDPRRSIDSWVCSGEEHSRWKRTDWEEAACLPDFQVPKTQGTSVPILFDVVSAMQRAPYFPVQRHVKESQEVQAERPQTSKDPLLPSIGELFFQVHRSTGFLDDVSVSQSLLKEFFIPALKDSSERAIAHDMEQLLL